MNLPQLLANPELYDVDAEDGALLSKHGYIFRLDTFTNVFTCLRHDSGKYYVYIGSNGTVECSIKDTTEIHIEPDLKIVKSSLRIKQDHSDRWYIIGDSKKEFAYGNDPNAEEKLINLLHSAYGGDNIFCNYSNHKVEFDVNLRCIYDDQIFELIKMGLISKEQFKLWLQDF
jgi:hypothetical protein